MVQFSPAFLCSRTRPHTILVSDWSSYVCSSDLPIWSPASTEAASATLVMAMAPQLTVIPTGPTERSEERRVGKESRWWTTPQVERKVGEVMWKLVLGSPDRLVGPKDSTPADMQHPLL